MLNQATKLVKTSQAASQCVAVAMVSLPECDSIAHAALRHLQASIYFEFRALSCEYQGGVLILRGQVSTWYQKQLVQESVRCVSGVEVIINSVDVVDPSQRRGG